MKDADTYRAIGKYILCQISWTLKQCHPSKNSKNIRELQGLLSGLPGQSQLLSMCYD